MSQDSVRADTLQHFIPRFSGAEIVVPNTEEPNIFPFIEFSFVESEGHNAAVGRKLKRHLGFVQVDVFVRENTGTKASNDLIQAIKDILENITLNATGNESITYSVGKAQPVGTTNGRYRQMVRIPYRRDILT